VESALILLSMWMMDMCSAERVSSSTWPALRVREQLQRVRVRPASAVGHRWPLVEVFGFGGLCSAHRRCGSCCLTEGGVSARFASPTTTVYT
jgi:hypothetical protein